MSLNKFMQDPDEKPFHSSGYAEAANKGGLGSTSYQTFNQRMRIENNRRSIRKYRDSMVAKQHAQRHRYALQDPTTTPQNAAQTPQNSRQAANAGAQNLSVGDSPNSTKPTRTSFQEPSGRNYNPYK